MIVKQLLPSDYNLPYHNLYDRLDDYININRYMNRDNICYCEHRDILRDIYSKMIKYKDYKPIYNNMRCYCNGCNYYKCNYKKCECELKYKNYVFTNNGLYMKCKCV